MDRVRHLPLLGLPHHGYRHLSVRQAPPPWALPRPRSRRPDQDPARAVDRVGIATRSTWIRQLKEKIKMSNTKSAPTTAGTENGQVKSSRFNLDVMRKAAQEYTAS